ncbi:MAG: MFS transporter [Austwickia sp.]|nr:MFS transporter [Austwickia sp.]
MSTGPVAAPGDRPGLFTRESVSWIWYDLGTTGFNSVVVTFVYSVYITSAAFGDVDANSQALGTGGYVAAAIVALLAPVLGHRADRTRRPTLWLGLNSTIVLALIVGLWFVRPVPDWLWPGIAMLVIAQIFSEFAAVNYNSLLRRVSTPSTVGRISGIGWGSGYLGSIALLVLILFGLVVPGHFIPVPGDDAQNIRAAMLLTAIWYLAGMLPILIVLRDRRAGTGQPVPVPRESLAEAYRALARTVRRIHRESPNTLRFLIGSALFRDGLAGVFTYGGVLAAGTFGFSQQGVIVFAIAANLVAGVATVALSALDDKIGPKPIIIASLAVTIVAGLGIFVLHAGGAIVFWVLGLALCTCVGPPQSAARSMLARVIPPGREGEIFGLYQMTGRALSFLAPLSWTAFIALGIAVTGGGPAQYWGILGIVVVLLAGLLVLLPVHAYRTPEEAGFQVHDGLTDGVVEGRTP